MLDHQIRPAEQLGAVLTGRGAAEDLRHAIEREIARGASEVIVDFGGVLVMSPSFADELFAKLNSDVAARVRWENIDEDLQHLARFVRAGRPRS